MIHPHEALAPLRRGASTCYFSESRQLEGFVSCWCRMCLPWCSGNAKWNAQENLPTGGYGSFPGTLGAPKEEKSSEDFEPSTESARDGVSAAERKALEARRESGNFLICHPAIPTFFSKRKELSIYFQGVISWQLGDIPMGLGLNDSP